MNRTNVSAIVVSYLNFIEQFLRVFKHYFQIKYHPLKKFTSLNCKARIIWFHQLKKYFQPINTIWLKLFEILKSFSSKVSSGENSVFFKALCEEN